MVVVHDVTSATNGEASGTATSRVPLLPENATWSTDAVKVAGGKRWGNDLSHLNFPSAIYVNDDDETLFIADYSNHRILEWKVGEDSGKVVVGAGGVEDKAHRLYQPTDFLYDKETDCFIIADEGARQVVRCTRNGLYLEPLLTKLDPYGLAMDKEKNLYVCDHKEHVVKRYKFDPEKGLDKGVVVAGGRGKGAKIDQLSLPTYIQVDDEQSVYVSDWANHRVVKWKKGAKQGIIVAGAQGCRHDLMPLAGPFGLAVDPVGTIYACDWEKHRIVRWPEGEKNCTFIAGDGANANGAHQFSHPMCLAFDKKGNLYVSDYSNHRVQKFTLNTNTE